MFLHEFFGGQRRARHVSQTEIARRIHSSQSAWNGIERGRAHPRLTTLARIGEVMGFEVAIHTPQQTFVMKLRSGKLILEPAAASQAKTHHALKAIDGLTPEQVGIVAKVAALLRP